MLDRVAVEPSVGRCRSYAFDTRLKTDHTDHMSKKIFVTSENNPRKSYDHSFVGDARTYEIDFSQWAEENSAVTSVTWEAAAGTVGISGQTLSSNVATALLSSNDIAGALVKITAATATETFVTYIDLIIRDPKTQYNDDYGMGR